MGKKKTESKTLETSTIDSKSNTDVTKLGTFATKAAEPPKQEEPSKPVQFPTTPKFTGPLIAFRNIDVKAGGIVSVQCLDDRVPLGKIQMIEIKAGDATYVYRRV